MTKKGLLIVWVLLIVLTIVAAVFGKMDLEFGVEVILGLAGVKFLLVAFYFMDIKKAHIFWKSSIFIFITLLIIFISFIIKE